MSDVFSKEERSRIMRSVKSNQNKSTELRLIEYFRFSGVTGWRRKYNLFGKPDFVFPKQKIAVFVDGCFWHGHDCRNTKPKTNPSYWQAKIARNRLRDEQVSKTLQEKGWIVFRLWECDLKNISLLNEIFNICK